MSIQTQAQKPIPVHHSGACATCAVPRIERAGLGDGDHDYIVALAGNPNVGKSTVFNALTGLRQHTGNWPGKTVTRAEGQFNYEDRKFKLVDLPGTYSLLATSEDEAVARDFILFGEPDVTVVVLDATRLERNLNLMLQVLEITENVVGFLNLMDEAKRHGITVDVRALSRELGVPVVPGAARINQGIPELVQAVDEVARKAYRPNPHRVSLKNPKLIRAVADVAKELEAAFPGLPNLRWVALRLLDGDPRIVQAVQTGELAELVAAQHQAPPAYEMEAVG